MPVINNIRLGQSETKIFRIFNGNVQEITAEQAGECSGSPITVVAFNSRNERVGGGNVKEFTDTCSAFPRAIIHQVPSRVVWEQPQPISYAISKNNITLVVGTIAKSDATGVTGNTGGSSTPEPPSDPNFGGESVVDSPSVGLPSASSTTLPTGNGNTGFTTGGVAGPQTGINGGNA